MDLIEKENEVILKDKGLEGLLLTIAKHGKVGLHQFSSGHWYCRCEMRVSGVGINFEVTSDSNHVMPIEAARTCLFRITETLAKYGIPV